MRNSNYNTELAKGQKNCIKNRGNNFISNFNDNLNDRSDKNAFFVN